MKLHVLSALTFLALSFLPLTANAAWSPTENFDSYTNSSNLNTLNGGSGWTAAWVNNSANFTISNAQSVTSPNAVFIAAATTGGAGVPGVSAPSRRFTDVSSGEFSVSIYKSGTGDAGYFWLSNSSAASTWFAEIGLELGNWVVYDRNGVRQINTVTSTGAWHTFKMRFNASAGTFAVSFDGGAYSSDFAFGTTNPDTFGLYKGTSGLTANIYYDSLTPIAAAAATPALIQTTSGWW